MLDIKKLMEIFPKAGVKTLTPFLNDTLKNYGIDSDIRLAYFFANISHESTGLTRLEENLNYSPQRLVQVFPKKFPNIAIAKNYAYNPQKLANKLYGGRYGNNYDNDGWLYRGKGFIQLTFKDNYKLINDVCGFKIVSIVDHPELVAQPDYALVTSCGYVLSRHCNSLADNGNFSGYVEEINSASLGYKERLKEMNRIMKILKR